VCVCVCSRSTDEGVWALGEETSWYFVPISVRMKDKHGNDLWGWCARWM